MCQLSKQTGSDKDKAFSNAAANKFENKRFYVLALLDNIQQFN